MTTFIVSITAAIIAYAVTAATTKALVRVSPLTRRNYRGLEIPTGLGLSVLLGLLAGAAWIAVVRLFADDSLRLREAAGESIVAFAAAAGFGLLGLWDDVTAGAGGRGWRAHLTSLREGRPTSGAIKLAGGGALALVLATARGEDATWTLVGAAILALSANLFNLLDLRPGRASKWLLIAIAPMLVLGGATAPILAAALGATLAFLPFDLRERGMLGDCGANALGAVVGTAIVARASHPVEVGTLVILIALHVLGERPGLSRAIDAVPPLRRLDRAGRVPE